MSENPVMQTPASEIPYRAVYPFVGWRLYDKTGTNVSNPAALFTPGQKAKNLTTTANVEFTLVPEWEAQAEKVVLPEASCSGYTFEGWALSSTEKDSAKIYTGEYIPVQDTIFYGVWKPDTKEVVLDGMGADIQVQETVVIVYDEEAPEVTIPSKEHHIFQGYYTELDADGRPTNTSLMVIDESGKGCIIMNNANGTFDDVATLYAYWEPKELQSAEISIFSIDPTYVVNANLKEEPELPVFEWREYGDTMLELSVTAMGYFEYAVLKAQWEDQERIFYWDDGTYIAEDDTWMKNENIVFWRSQMDYPEEEDIVRRYPGYYDQTYTITVKFYSGNELAKEYKLGLWMVSWETWGEFIHPSRTEGHWDFNGDGVWDKYPFYHGNN